ncbi:MAG: regulator of (H+)-ATPase in vacuolar membrane [Vezdaea aestivalis]|nr:MAG: regulator of (H+)-ATPase in vacuolar membrane [Vezdaea aestivalis]
MRAILPGKPQAKLQAVCTGQWEAHRIVAYISGNSVAILGGPYQLLQTIYLDDGVLLEALVLDEETGKFAACSKDLVYILRPYGRSDGDVKWSLQWTVKLDQVPDDISSLSWGSSEELLIGSAHLTLCTTAEEPEKIWTKELANAAKLALFSPDASLIASTGRYDRLVKIWRRLSFGWNDVRFDFAYLPHPQTVVGIEWRRPFHRDQTIDNVLYTISADNFLRIWAPTDPHSLQILQLWSQIDLQESINPRLFGSDEVTSNRYTFIINSRDFSLATERAVELNADQDLSQALEHTIEIANRSPEVCVVMDDKGRMSAWGIENIGSKVKSPKLIFNVAHVKGIDMSFLGNDASQFDKVQFHSFCGDQPGQSFSVVVHQLNGPIHWINARIDLFFAPSPTKPRWERKAAWTGHSHPIQKIVRSATGSSLVSRTADNCAILWTQVQGRDGVALRNRGQIHTIEHIHRVTILGDGSHVVLLHPKKISLWDIRGAEGSTTSLSYEIQGKPLCLVLLPDTQLNNPFAHVATISTELKGIVWEIDLSVQKHPKSNGYANGSSTREPLREFCHFDLGLRDDLDFVLPVDPAGSPTVISGFVDIFARDVIIAYTKCGVLRAWTAKVDRSKSEVVWLLTSTVETGISNPSLASGTSIRKTALVNAERTGLSIWDSASRQLEFDETFPTKEIIQDLDWTSTPDEQSILGVGFHHRVILMSQLRYDYINAGPAWGPIREIRIRDLTSHPIGDSIWLSGGSFVIGTGNQLFVYGKEIDTPHGLVGDVKPNTNNPSSMNLFDVVRRLNGTLPVFHPQFIGQSILAGKIKLAQRILLELYKALRFYIEGDELNSFLNISSDEFVEDNNPQQSSHLRKLSKVSIKQANDEDDYDNKELDEGVAAELTEKLMNFSIPQLSPLEQIHLADIVQCAATAEKHKRSMDENAYRYLLFFRQHMIRSKDGPASEMNVSWREIVWAYHSNSQDILIDLVSRQFQGRLLWERARESGLFMWLRDVTALRAQMEIVARNQYTQTDEKNPVDCSLFYFALRKKNVVLGLWRMASWNREQRSTQRLLANDFQETNWKTTALKNAYALLGKHRYEYAAAFFLLADCLKDAVNVCANQMDDIQLAIAITRVYDGDDSPLLKDLIEEKVLPEAARLGNRWLATWAFWMLGRRDLAVRSLISPIYTLLKTPSSPDLRSKLFLTNDPALVIMYKQLRDMTLQTLKGASKIHPKAEWDFVMHNARHYDRMGCDFLALDLVRNWEFPSPQSEKRTSRDGSADPELVLRRRSSLVADLSSPKVPPTGQAKPPPNAFGQRHGAGSGRGRGGGGGWQNQRVDYKQIPRENAKLQSYYDGLLGLSEEERAEFWAALKRDLPNSFRFCGSKGNALAVQRRLVQDYVPEITKMDAYEGEVVEPPKPVSWYPDDLAWSMTAPKNIVRRYPPFAAFQKFLVSETSVGNISRQELVSMIPPLLMDIKRGMTILDLCAAPGSKTCQLVELMHKGEEAMTKKFLRRIAQESGGNVSPDGMEKVEDEEEQEAAPSHNDWSDDGRSTGMLIANDVDYKRSHMLIHQTKRLHSPNLIVTNHDATLFPSIRLPSQPSTNGQKHPVKYLKFDRILADVPCSGDGTLRKNMAIWKEWTPGNALGLHITQIRILVRALQLLKVGGRVVYSTCSLNPIENEAVVAASIKRCGGLDKVKIVDCSDVLPELKKKPGLSKWKVMGKTGRSWSSWDEVEQARRHEGEEAVLRLFETNFPPSENDQSLPLEKCTRVYPHLQDTGGFFICVLEKRSEIKAKPESEQKTKPTHPRQNKQDEAPIVAAVNELETKEEPNNGSVAHLEALDQILPQQQALFPVESAAARQNRDQTVENGLKRQTSEEASVDLPVKRLKVESPKESMPDSVDQGTEKNELPDSRGGDTALPPEFPPLNVTPSVAQTSPMESETRPDVPLTRRRGGAPFEEPFIFLPADHPELEFIFRFYNLHARFPRNRFMVRNSAGMPTKGIYYTSGLCRDILMANEGSGIKFIHCGVKMFVKQDIQLQETCPWRIQSEGLPIIEAWVGGERVVKLHRKSTLRKLLIQMFPKVSDGAWQDLGEMGEWARDASTGCCVLKVEVSDEVDGFTERLVFPLWRSLHSINLMLPKEDRRAMLLRLYNEDVPTIENRTLKQQAETRTEEVDAPEALTESHAADDADSEIVNNGDLEI